MADDPNLQGALTGTLCGIPAFTFIVLAFLLAMLGKVEQRGSEAELREAERLKELDAPPELVEEAVQRSSRYWWGVVICTLFFVLALAGFVIAYGNP
jgi:hypothetical protein